MRLRAYRALRPLPATAARVACLPYDVVTLAEARAIAAGNPLSMMRVVRPDLEFPDGTDPYSGPVYDRARENFERLQREGHLVRETAPSLYIYRQHRGGHVQTGVAALCSVADYDSGLIKRHEKTRRDKEDDRVRHTGTLSANPGPVFLAHRDEPAVDRAVAAATAGAPLLDFVAPDGVRHQVWRAEETGPLLEAFARVPVAYIADGHHRAASAARVARERRAAHPGATGEEDFNWFLTVLFPASHLRILPYHRLVLDLHGRTPDQFLAALRAVGPLAAGAGPESSGPGDVRVFLAGHGWHALRLDPPPGTDPVTRLDVSQLQDRVLGPLLGIDDPRTNQRIEFVGGIRGPGFLEQAVNAGRAAVGFSLAPVTLDQLMAIADADQIMPPKSTWFEPKLLDGLFMHVF